MVGRGHASNYRITPRIKPRSGKYPTDHPITLRELASHTGGLVREPELEGAAAGPMDQWEQRIFASIPTTRVQSAPGSQYSYSNIGYGILGLTVSHAANRPFMVLVIEDIFDPLGMTTAGFRPTPVIAPLLAAGYVVNRQGTIDPGPPAREHGGRGYKEVIGCSRSFRCA